MVRMYIHTTSIIIKYVFCAKVNASTAAGVMSYYNMCHLYE